MMTRQGGAAVTGRSEGIEMAVRLPGKIDAMVGERIDSTEEMVRVKGGPAPRFRSKALI